MLAGPRHTRPAVLGVLALFLAVVAVSVVPASTGAVSAPATTGFMLERGEGCSLATVDLATGAVTDLPAAEGTTACVDDLALAPDGSLFGAREASFGGPVELVSFDTTTGEPTALGTLTGSFTTSTLYDEDLGVAFGADGTLYVTMGTDDPACTSVLCLYSVDPSTLAASLVGPAGAPGGSFDDKPLIQMTAGCSGPLLTSVLRISGELVEQNLVTIDEATGAATEGATAEMNFTALEVDRTTGSLYGVSSDRSGQTNPALVLIDPVDGSFTTVAELTGLTGNPWSLAIPGACAVPVSTTTPPPAVAADTVAPAFTG